MAQQVGFLSVFHLIVISMLDLDLYLVLIGMGQVTLMDFFDKACCEGIAPEILNGLLLRVFLDLLVEEEK